MKRKCHAYLATRAVALLARDPATEALARMLAPNLPLVAVGAWLPDEKFFKTGSGDTQNHVLKMAEYSGPNNTRFVHSRLETMRRLGDYRAMHGVLRDKERLPDDFWLKAYRGDCPHGEHPADCAMGLATSLTDLLLLGGEEIQHCLPKLVNSWIELPARAMTTSTQAALYFFMMSHYIADAHMPCHTDARPLAKYEAKLHAKWEGYLDDLVATFPDPDAIRDHTPAELLESAVDAFELDLPDHIPELKGDIWEEVIWICRGSFALSCIVASPEAYPLVKTGHGGYEKVSPASAQMPSFSELFHGREALRDELSHAILHDSVLAVAMGWKNVWRSLSKMGHA